MNEHWHGTLGGYTNHGCHCAGCTAAMRDYMRDYDLRRGLLPGFRPGEFTAVMAHDHVGVDEEVDDLGYMPIGGL